MECKKQCKRSREINFSRKDIKSTHDLINANAKMEVLPDKIIINTHPLRWTEKPPVWLYNYLDQSFKNILKNILKRLEINKETLLLELNLSKFAL